MAFAISVEKMLRPLQADLCGLGMEVIIGKLSALTIQPTIMEAIKGGQLTDPLMEKFKRELEKRGDQISLCQNMECWVIKAIESVCQMMRKVRNIFYMKLTIPFMPCTRAPQKCIET